MLYFKGKVEKGEIFMKKIRLIFALTLAILAICALGACSPVEFEPIDPNTVYTVSFDSAGGSSVDSQEIKRGEKIEEPDVPTRAGYEFAGWYSGSIAWLFDSYTVRKDMTLTARWKSAAHTVTFVTDEYDTEPYKTVRVSYGGKVKALPADPTRENYIFKGWYVDGNLWNPEEPIYADTELTALWKRVFTVTFDMGGIVDAEPCLVEEGDRIPAPDTSEVTTHRLVGWTVNGEAWTMSTPVYTDMTVTAEWQRTYWISFNCNGGERIEPYQVDEGAIISPPEIPYMYGHYFVGWQSKSDDGFTLEDHDFTKPVMKNIKLEADWIIRSGNTIYDDQTRMKIILPDNYRFSDGEHITGLKNALNRHLIFDAEAVSASSHTLVVKYTEIVIGRSDRQISVDAYEKLEKINKTSPTAIRYLVYVGTVMVSPAVYTRSVCIAYDEDADGFGIKLAIEAFIDTYLQNDTLSMIAGVHSETCIEPSSYLQTSYASEVAIVAFGKEEI